MSSSDAPRVFIGKEDEKEASTAGEPIVIPMLSAERRAEIIAKQKEQQKKESLARHSKKASAEMQSEKVANAKAERLQNRPSFYRKPSFVLGRGVGEERAIESEIVKHASKMAKKGVVHTRTLSALAVMTSGVSFSPYAVENYSLLVQIHFRRKLYSLLAIESIMSFLIAVLVYVVFQYQQDSLFYSSQAALGTAISVFAGLILLFFVKYYTPWNYIVFVLFSVAKGLAVGIAVSRNRYLLELLVFLASFVVIAILHVIFTAIVFDYNTDMARAISIPRASLIVWVIYCGLACAVLLPLKDIFLLGEFVLYRNLIFNTLLIMWFAFDGDKMMQKLAVDEYMQGVTFFYTDIILIFLLLVFSIFACVHFCCSDDDANGNDEGLMCCTLLLLGAASSTKGGEGEVDEVEAGTPNGRSDDPDRV